MIIILKEIIKFYLNNLSMIKEELINESEEKVKNENQEIKKKKMKKNKEEENSQKLLSVLI